MSNTDYIYESYKEGKEIYIMDDLEDVAVRYCPTKEGCKTYAKFIGESEYKIYEKSNIVTIADMGGTILTKEQFYIY
ncbi:MAG TPA: hypothetical protein DEB12_12455 [Porphyromonadaceae bacterium]|jgi:hypothetical protein|nr:hypothetical protein [Fermentimonas sp.]HBT86699.1 hypothetical protein [Porphyromonadaceae bacterium]